MARATTDPRDAWLRSKETLPTRVAAFVDWHKPQTFILRRFHHFSGKHTLPRSGHLSRPYCCQKPHVIDARRLKDDELVAIKRCNNNSREVQIAQYLSTLHDPRNHSVAVLETFPDPLDPQLTLMVMPFLRPCNDPEFRNIGEVIDFIDQTLEVRPATDPAFTT